VKYYQLMTMLPALPETPEAPPMALAEIWPLVRQSMEGSDMQGAMAVMEFLDCRNLESILQGHDAFDERAPRPRQELEEREDLPEYMNEFLQTWDSGAAAGPYAFDELWRAYFANLWEQGAVLGSRFLQDWATWETTMRNALVRDRAARLGWEVEPRLLEPRHGEPSVGALVMQVREAADPLTGKRLLDMARLDAISEARGLDPFGRDAVYAYLAAMLVLDGWAMPKETHLAELLEQLG